MQPHFAIEHFSAADTDHINHRGCLGQKADADQSSGTSVSLPQFDQSATMG
jgi:hypothetical protein